MDKIKKYWWFGLIGLALVALIVTAVWIPGWARGRAAPTKAMVPTVTPVPEPTVTPVPPTATPVVIEKEVEVEKEVPVEVEKEVVVVEKEVGKETGSVAIAEAAGCEICPNIAGVQLLPGTGCQALVNATSNWTVPVAMSADHNGRKYAARQTVPSGAATLWGCQISTAPGPVDCQISQYGSIQRFPDRNDAVLLHATAAFDCPKGWSFDHQGVKYAEGQKVPAGDSTAWAPQSCAGKIW